MPDDLIRFWQQCELNNAPFVHPKDLLSLRASNRWTNDHPGTFNEYVEGVRFANSDDDQLHLSLLPVPYVGDLRNAEIVVLLLNPGFAYGDYWAESHGPGFRERVVGNLLQSFEGNEFPFMFLDPRFCWSGGFIWWEKKLRKVIKKIAMDKFESNYRKAMQSLSSRLACVELFPYHSSIFGEHGLLNELPSVEAARQFVHNKLVPDAAAGKRTLVVTRQVKTWGIETGALNVIAYEGGHTRGASLSPDSLGGKAILQRYGIS